MWIFDLYVSFTVCCALYIIAIAADLITTKIALDRGLSEGNPIMNSFKNPVLASGIVSLATVIFAVVAARIETTTSHAALFCLIFATYRFGCAGNNFFILRKKASKNSN